MGIVRLVGALLVSGLVALGCGSSDGDDDGLSGVGGSGNGVGGNSSTSIGGTAGVGAGGAATTGEPDTSAWMLPLKAGRTWNFDLEAMDPSMDVGCTSSSAVAKATTFVSVSLPEGTPVKGWLYQTACSAFTFLLWMDGDNLMYVQVTDITTSPITIRGKVLTFLVDPKVATTWMTGPDTNTWESVGSVTVAAGTYSDCWLRSVETTEINAIYCRGAGLVQSTVSGGNYRLELVGMVDE